MKFHRSVSSSLYNVLEIYITGTTKRNEKLKLIAPHEELVRNALSYSTEATFINKKYSKYIIFVSYIRYDIEQHSKTNNEQTLQLE